MTLLQTTEANNSYDIFNYLLKQPGIEINEKEFMGDTKLTHFNFPSTLTDLKKINISWMQKFKRNKNAINCFKYWQINLSRMHFI